MGWTCWNRCCLWIMRCVGNVHIFRTEARTELKSNITITATVATETSARTQGNRKKKTTNKIVSTECVTRAKLFSTLKSLRKQLATTKANDKKRATDRRVGKILLKQQNVESDKIVVVVVGLRVDSSPSWMPKMIFWWMILIARDCSISSFVTANRFRRAATTIQMGTHHESKLGYMSCTNIWL